MDFKRYDRDRSNTSAPRTARTLVEATSTNTNQTSVPYGTKKKYYVYAKARQNVGGKNYEFVEWVLDYNPNYLSVDTTELTMTGAVGLKFDTIISKTTITTDNTTTAGQKDEITLWVKAKFREVGATPSTSTLSCEAPAAGGSYSFTYNSTTTNVSNANVNVANVENEAYVELTATANEYYVFSRFYAIVNNVKQTLGYEGAAQQWVELPVGTTAIGADYLYAGPITCEAPAAGGSYSFTYNYATTTISTENEDVDNVAEEATVSLSASPAAGYRFHRFYAIVNGEKRQLGNALETPQLVTLPEGTTTVGAEFSNRTFYVGGVFIDGFQDAISYATAAAESGGDATIVVLKDVTISGSYTIPAGVSLLIPYKDTQYSIATLERVNTSTDPSGAFCTLTLASGAHLEVHGTIEVGACQTTGGVTGGADRGVGRPGAPQFGELYMKSGSSITLNNGAKFNAWGYVLGDATTDEEGNYKYLCEIDVRRGATVYEMFQMMDWKWVEAIIRICDGEQTYHVLPINQYHIQNIEVPARYRPGAKLLGAASIDVGGTQFVMNDAGVIGVKYASTQDYAVFLMDNEDESEDTWVRKYYDPSTDQQVYEANNSAYLGSLVMKVTVPGISAVSSRITDDEINVDSRAYKLPITNNFKLHLLTGNMYITQDTEMLPGSVIEVNKKSTLTVNSGQKLWFWDSDEWDAFVATTYNSTYDYSFGYASRIKYRPGGVPGNDVRNIEDKDKLGDAKLIVHGTVDVKGYLKTTESGATISSTIEDAGTVKFTTAAPAESSSDKIWQITSLANPITWTSRHCVPAKLTNDAGSADGAWASTAETAAGQSFCFVDIDEDGKGEWKNMTDVVEYGCARFAKDQYNVYYIKPQAYVPISMGSKPDEEESDHTFRDHYKGTNKIFIEVDCQWWEVKTTNIPGVYHCEHELNDTYYYYDEDGGVWVEKKFNVTFKNWNDTILTFKDKDNQIRNHYELTYGSHPDWYGSTPTRTGDLYATYTFSGWAPAITPSTIVTGDTVFVAQFTENVRNYAITFNDKNGTLMRVDYYTYGATPTTPTAPSGYHWSPNVGNVTGNQTYQLVADVAGPYTITWKNWDGSVLKTDNNVSAGTTPSYTGTPTKASDTQYSYTFEGWTPTPSAANADAIYTATYGKSALSYTIRFFQEDGTTPIGDPQELSYGEVPEVPTYSKASSDTKIYTLKWSPLVSAATKNQDYEATFTEETRLYQVKWMIGEEVLESNYFEYNQTPSYTGIAPTKASDSEYAYKFTGWSPAIAAVTCNQEYVAQFDPIELNKKVSSDEEYSNAMTLNTITISSTGKLTLNSGAYLTAENLILESTGSESGQLIANVVNAENFYFDLKLNAVNHTWYGFAVPWQVDAQTGISVNGKTLELGKDFDIIYYDGARRASEGKQKCWKYVEDDDNKTLVPGRLYMIGLMGDAPVIRFAKKAGAAILTTSTSVTAYAQTTGVNTDAGWNGVANPALFHAFVNPGVTYGQVYKSDTRDYDPITLSDAKFVVGQGAFVSVDADKAITVSKDAPFSPASAPRNTRTSNVKYEVRLAPAEANYTSRLYIETTDDKETDEYIVGQDLAKIGVSSLVPQMWINRYNEKLCVNTQELQNEKAEYPLGISVPANGEYTISNLNDNEDYTLYLTLNNEAIWNLSDAPYTLDLTKGTTNAYGLRISAKAPQVVTGVDEAVVDAKGETKKVLINNQVFIIRGNEVYTIDGQLVK